MKKILFISFGFIVLIQLSLLGSRVYKYENVLQNGKVFYFKPKPVDPRDLLKGRYVILNFNSQSAKCNADELKDISLKYFYVTISKNDKNTTIGKAYVKKPKSGDFLKVKSYRSCENSSISFYFLFDRFYMNEYKAKKVEKAYNKLINKQNVLAKVRVLDGVGVIEDLLINSKSVKEYVME